jgi:hypothetical protein
VTCRQAQQQLKKAQRQFLLRLSIVTKLIVFLGLNAGIVSRMPTCSTCEEDQFTPDIPLIAPCPQLVYLFVLALFNQQYMTASQVTKEGWQTRFLLLF